MDGSCLVKIHESSSIKTLELAKFDMYIQMTPRLACHLFPTDITFANIYKGKRHLKQGAKCPSQQPMCMSQINNLKHS